MNRGRPEQLDVVKALVATGADVNQTAEHDSVMAGLGPAPALQLIRNVLLRAGAHR